MVDWLALILIKEGPMLPAQVAQFCNEIISGPSRDVTERNIAWNLLHEHRISPKRADHWESTIGGAISHSLQMAVSTYRDAIQADPDGTFLGPANSVNLLRFSPDLPGPTDELVQVLDLTSRNAVEIWRFGKDELHLPILNRLDLSSVDSLATKLTENLEGRDVEDQAPLLAAFFDAQAEYVRRNRGALGPQWVALWDDWFRRVDGGSPDSWANAVGLHKPKAGRWLVALRYPALRALRLICPTQLEAGWFPRHFPSAPACVRETGGRIVQNDAWVPQPPLREYLHEPIPLTVRDWLLSGLPAMATRGAVGVPASLNRDREVHWEGCGMEIGQSVMKGWMERANG